MLDNNSPKTKTANVIYSCHPKVKWVVEAHGLILIHHELEKSLTLNYPDAAVWDFVCQGFSYFRMVNLMTKITSTSFEGADRLVRNCLENLEKKGFLLKST